MRIIEIYTDGACSGNPGKGGYGVVIKEGNTILDIISIQCPTITTNNIEELKAMLLGLKYARLYKLDETAYCKIYSDSAYVVNICNDWIWKWHDNGWMTSKKQPIENIEIVQDIFNALNELSSNLFEINKIKGHSGIPGNELADAAATQNQNKINKIIKENNFISNVS